MNKEIEEFKRYTKSYILLSDQCVLKVNHTFRVMELCDRIAKGLNLSDEEIYIANMCGLLHDIGRFEQWKRYQTFVDSKSIDHGDLGVEILKENNFIRKFISNREYDSVILTAIKYHNKYSIPDTLTEKELLFTKILRDADKIDILYLYTINEIEVDTKDEAFTEDVLKSLLSKKLIDRKIKKNKADSLAVSLGFIYDINFYDSFKILDCEGYIDKEIDIYKEKSKNSELKNQLEEVRKVINCYIKERLEDVR